MDKARCERLEKAIQTAWNRVFDKLYYPKTHMIYDFLMGDSIEDSIDKYPTAEEIKNSFPNPCGWGTGMEDSTLNLCPMIDAIILRYRVTGDPDMKRYADEIIQGIIINGTVSEEKGFIARCVAPCDGKSHYIDSSRDQYTNWIYAAHILLSSELATDEQKQTIREVLVNVAKKAQRDVKPENMGCMCRLDGKPGIVSCMDSERLGGHETLRLPMMYAAAYEASGDMYWLNKYHEIRDRFLEWAEKKFTAEPFERDARNGGYIYGPYQHQYSARILYDIETEPRYRARYKAQMHVAAKAATAFLEEAYKSVNKISQVDPMRAPWRSYETYDICDYGHRYSIPKGLVGPGGEIFKTMRNSSEAIIVKAICPDYEISERDLEMFYEIVEKGNFGEAKMYWPVLFCDAWWLLKAKGIV